MTTDVESGTNTFMIQIFENYNLLNPFDSHGSVQTYAHPLLTACHNSDMEAVRTHLGHLTAEEAANLPAYMAVAGPHAAEIYGLLLESGLFPAVNERWGNYTPLHQACRHRQHDAIKFLLQRPEIKANALTKTGQTPLGCACADEADLLAMKLLLATGQYLTVTEEKTRCQGPAFLLLQEYERAPEATAQRLAQELAPQSYLGWISSLVWGAAGAVFGHSAN